MNKQIEQERKAKKHWWNKEYNNPYVNMLTQRIVVSPAEHDRSKDKEGQ